MTIHAEWTRARERVLIVAGLALIAAEFVNGEVFGRTYHFEFLLAGLALCGISITNWPVSK